MTKAVTLEDLKADYEAACQQLDAYLEEFSALPFKQPSGQFRKHHPIFFDLLSKRELARTIYEIARDEGLEAAMLWKLANA